jgi:molybdopterin/thiamine biosynthesis adenylyltransferase
MDVMSQVVWNMIGWGFTKVTPQPESPWLVMRGNLPTNHGAVPCEVWIDSEFFQPLQVRLLEIPAHLPRVVPHLGPDGHLCYAAPGTEVIDIFDPVAQTLMSLRQAINVLDQVLAGKMVEDLQEEFFAYWRGCFCFHDVERSSTGALEVLELSDRKGYVLTDNIARSQVKFARAGRTIRRLEMRVDMITSSEAPRPLQNDWPPKNVAQILDWQGELDNACRRKIFRKIRTAYREGAPELLIVIESQKYGYSYGFFVRKLQRDRRPGERSINQRLPIFDCPIEPVYMNRLDDKYLIERNIPGRATLSGKRIALIGCGTIGGFLAEMLIKAGAGSGGGEIRLIDNDELTPQNLGRHRLGFNHLFENKARALADELRTSMPSLNVLALPADVKEADLDGLDLIIDATGEESLGHWLAKHASASLLHVWIEGAGVAVRSLLKHHAKQGCYRCLTDDNHQGALLSVVNGVAPLFAGQGCEGLYVPFPASVSVQAAALGLDAALAWVGDQPWPTLATRITDQNFQLETPACSVLPRPGCPACRS